MEGHMKFDDLMKMELGAHVTTDPDGTDYVTRVPGGWVYSSILWDSEVREGESGQAVGISNVFVPEPPDGYQWKQDKAWKWTRIADHARKAWGRDLTEQALYNRIALMIQESTRTPEENAEMRDVAKAACDGVAKAIEVRCTCPKTEMEIEHAHMVTPCPAHRKPRPETTNG